MKGTQHTAIVLHAVEGAQNGAALIFEDGSLINYHREKDGTWRVSGAGTLQLAPGAKEIFVGSRSDKSAPLVRIYCNTDVPRVKYYLAMAVPGPGEAQVALLPQWAMRRLDERLKQCALDATPAETFLAAALLEGWLAARYYEIEAFLDRHAESPYTETAAKFLDQEISSIFRRISDWRRPAKQLEGLRAIA